MCKIYNVKEVEIPFKLVMRFYCPIQRTFEFSERNLSKPVLCPPWEKKFELDRGFCVLRNLRFEGVDNVTGFVSRFVVDSVEITYVIAGKTAFVPFYDGIIINLSLRERTAGTSPINSPLFAVVNA